MNPGTTTGELDWLLTGLAASADGVRAAVILSSDGIALGRSPDLGHAQADHLAALASAAQGLADGVGTNFDMGTVSQVIVEMANALVFITSSGGGTSIAVVTDANADAGQIAHEMAVLVKRVGQHMIAGPRNVQHSATA
jgi:predicted regulator of Ras-like GTPase activity (Roadblock/LC7/MglB family)